MYSQNYSATIGAQASPFYENRDIRPVNQIHISGAVNVFFKPAVQPCLVIGGDFAEAVKSVKTAIVGSTLQIRRDAEDSVMLRDGDSCHYSVAQSIGNIRINVNHQVNVIVSDASASVSVSIGGVPDAANSNQGRVIAAVSLPQAPAIDHMGDGKVILAELQQERLPLRLSGAGKIEAQGRVTELHASLSGLGEINTWALMAQQADLDLRSKGMIKVYAEKKLRSGMFDEGTIIVRGNPFSREIYGVGLGKIIFSNS